MNLALGLLLFPMVPLLAAPATGPIENGGFESAQIAPWKTGGFAVDSSVKHSGNRSLKATGGPEARSLTGGKFPIDIDTVYTVSLWIKTKDISTPDGVSVKIFQRNDSTGWNSWYPTTHNDLPVERRVIKTGGTQEWTEHRFSFTPDAAAEFVEISLEIEPGITGTAWIDDVSLSATSTRIAQRDFTGDWHNVKIWGDQVRWVDKTGAVDKLEITLPQGEYFVWLSQMGGNRPDIEVAVDGKVLGTGDGRKPTGWQQPGKVALAAGPHHFTLTSKDPNGFKNQAAYAGMIISTDPNTKLPDWSERFSTPLETLPVTLSPAAATDKKLVMVFSAYLVETGFSELGAVGFPASGAARIAAVAHKHGIPVTWLVDNRSAVKMKDLLTKWHNEFGDDVASFDWKDWGPVKEALPWASTTSAAAGSVRNIAELEDAGMKSAWGWCWEQAGVDNITDRGAPWAPFYGSRHSYKAPANYPGKTLVIEWTARDLNKSLHLHSGDPCTFSTDPDDVRRGRIVYGRAIEYWKQFLDEYLKNAAWNDMVPFFVQQESHEMEWSFPWTVNEGDNKLEANWKVVNMDALALDEFFKYAKSKNITFMTQPQFVAAYGKKYPDVTPAHYMLFRDIPVQETLRHISPGTPVTTSPYPLTFLFFDAECQMAFHEGERLPKMVYNYLHQAESTNTAGYTTEAAIPAIVSFDQSKTEGGEIWKITVSNQNPYAFPLGLTEWGDFSKATVVRHSENVKEVKPIGNSLLFLRGTAAPNSDSTFTVELKGELPVLRPQQVRTAPANLALGRPAMASSELVYNGVTYGAGLAVDGQTGTRWSSDFKDGEWLEVDLGDGKTVSGVELLWERACPAEYVIEISADGTNWKEVARNLNGKGGTEHLEFAPEKTRWVRMRTLKRATEFGVSLFEMRVTAEPLH